MTRLKPQQNSAEKLALTNFYGLVTIVNRENYGKENTMENVKATSSHTEDRLGLLIRSLSELQMTKDGGSLLPLQIGKAVFYNLYGGNAKEVSTHQKNDGLTFRYITDRLREAGILISCTLLHQSVSVAMLLSLVENTTDESPTNFSQLKFSHQVALIKLRNAPSLVERLSGEILRKGHSTRLTHHRVSELLGARPVFKARADCQYKDNLKRIRKAISGFYSKLNRIWDSGDAGPDAVDWGCVVGYDTVISEERLVSTLEMVDDLLLNLHDMKDFLKYKLDEIYEGNGV